MAVTAAEREALAKKIAAAGGDAKKAADYAGATSTPAEQAAEPPVEPKSSRSLPTLKGHISTTKSQRIIFGVMLFATAMTILGDVLSGRTSVTDAIPRRVAAGTIGGIMLMLLAIPVPRIAASLAGVIAVASLFVNPNGQRVLEAISKIGGTTSTTPGGGGGGGTKTVK